MKSEIHILIVEDDEDINRLLATVMKKQGYEVVSAYSGTEARLLLSMESFDLLLLDLKLPGVAGMEIVEGIRKSSYMPIIVISANSNLEEKIQLLGHGADDYITKPFEPKEVVARVEAQLRRYCKFSRQSEDKNIIQHGNMVIDKEARSVKIGEKEVALTSIEYDILLLLVSNCNRVFTRESIYKSVWSEDYAIEDNTVNVHISNLRSKLGKTDPDREYIKTVWGIGFKMI